MILDDALDIEVEKVDEWFVADAKCLPGSPPIGRGKSPYEAKYDLLAKIMWGHCFCARNERSFLEIAIRKLEWAVGEM